MTQYVMRGYEPGMYMEIYLPKKTIYQPFLFDVLTHGLDIAIVKAHFLDADLRPRINALIGKYVSWNDYDDVYVNDLRPFLFGYSMYEVDGVFKSSVPQTKLVVEERTQVIRLLFRLDIEDLTKEVGLGADQFRLVRAKACDYLRAHDRLDTLERAQGQDLTIYRAVSRWRDQLSFFVFGYLVFEFCRHIERLTADDRAPKTEDEIWVANFANVELDRVLFTGQSS